MKAVENSLENISKQMTSGRLRNTTDRSGKMLKRSLKQAYVFKQHPKLWACYKALFNPSSEHGNSISTNQTRYDCPHKLKDQAWNIIQRNCQEVHGNIGGAAGIHTSSETICWSTDSPRLHKSGLYDAVPYRGREAGESCWENGWNLLKSESWGRRLASFIAVTLHCNNHRY